MQKMFHNILMPVFLDKKTDLAIETAVGFSNHLSCDLHLFFIISPGFLNWYRPKEREARKKAKILLLKQKYQARLKDGAKLFTVSQSETNHTAVVKYAETHDIDMMLAPERSKHDDFYTRCLSVVNCPAISLKIDTGSPALRSIVLPIGSNFPINTIRIAAYLAKQFGLSMHLLSLNNDQRQKEMGYMKRAFELLKTNTDLPVVCHSIPGKKLDHLAMEYASEHAGMVVMNAVNASTDSGLMDKIMSKLIYKKANIPVLTI